MVVVTICDRLAVGAEVVPPGVVVWPEFGVAFRLIVGLLWAYLVHLGLSLASLWVYCGSICLSQPKPSPSSPIRAYAHCSRTQGQVTALLINLGGPANVRH